jgi:succinate-semialdehyde dehydrogenase/glutarate-semialdehyde dehydrogenase
VFDDADVNAAVAGAMASKNRNARQTGVCANRLYVQSAIHDAFVAEPIGAVGKPKVGNCEEEDALIGPLIDEAAVAKAQEHVDDALAKGGKVEAGGKALGD